MTPSLRVRAVGASTWTSLPEPSSLTVLYSDVDSASSGRGEDGVMIRDRVAVNRKLSIGYNVLTAAKASALLGSAIKNVFFELYFFDPKQNAWATGTFYVGDRQMQVFKRTASGEYIYEGASFDFVEK